MRIGIPPAERGNYVGNAYACEIYSFDDGTRRSFDGFTHFEACNTCGELASLLQPRSQMRNKAFRVRCNNCWEVERRLEDYIKRPNGLDFVRELLEGMGLRIHETSPAEQQVCTGTFTRDATGAPALTADGMVCSDIAEMFDRDWLLKQEGKLGRATIEVLSDPTPTAEASR